MSKLEELINTLCPNGVEYKLLGELCEIEKGKQLNKESLLQFGKYPVINGGINPSGFWNEFNFDKNLITISQGGASAGYVNYITTNFWAGAHCYVLVNPKYEINYRLLYHIIKQYEKELMSSQVGAGIPSVSSNKLSSLKIPVPPIEVQREIVRILDNFTELTSELTAELTTELTARKKQYEYYKHKIMFFDSNVPKYKLSDIFNTRNGYTPSKSNKHFWNKNEISWFRMEDIRENGRILDKAKQGVSKSAIKGTAFPANSIIVSTSATIGEHALLKCESLANQRFTYLMIKDEYKNKYNIMFLFYYCFVLDEFCKENLNQGNFASVDMHKFNDFEFPMPSLEEQERIVAILDRFDKLCNDISQGLPAEIEARKKQYVYYRDKLLTFKELS